MFQSGISKRQINYVQKKKNFPSFRHSLVKCDWTFYLYLYTKQALALSTQHSTEKPFFPSPRIANWWLPCTAVLSSCTFEATIRLGVEIIARVVRVIVAVMTRIMQILREFVGGFNWIFCGIAYRRPETVLLINGGRYPRRLRKVSRKTTPDTS